VTAGIITLVRLNIAENGELVKRNW